MSKITPHTKLSKLSRGVIFIVMIILFYFVGEYSFRCFVEKVCGVVQLDMKIRTVAVITTPQGDVKAEVANTKSSRELGLSGRVTMKDGEGLLFVFDNPGRYGFWMKDMKFPLDILWINSSGIVVEAVYNATPESYPQTYINALPASYVLELKAGQAKEFDISLGSKVKIDKY
jgi:uncharacterized membrane protein (UPF0127 family)